MTEFSESYQAPNESKSVGQKKRKVMTDALMLALNREVADSEGKPTKRITVIAEKLVGIAAEGDMSAIKEVFDRSDGKALQAIEASGPDGGAIELIKRVIVDGAGNKDP